MDDSKVSAEMGLMAIEDFLITPPPGIVCENGPQRSTVTSLSDNLTLLIDDFMAISGRRVEFNNSFGRIAEARRVVDCANLRKKLTSNLLLLLVAACENRSDGRKKNRNKPGKVLMHFILMINGNHPNIKVQMQEGLISAWSSPCEGYTLKVDFLTSLVKFTENTGFTVSDGSQPVTPAWQNTTFSLVYNSGASCNCATWFGLDKTKCSIEGQIFPLKNKTAEEKEEVEEFFKDFVPLATAE